MNDNDLIEAFFRNMPIDAESKRQIIEMRLTTGHNLKAYVLAHNDIWILVEDINTGLKQLYSTSNILFVQQ